MSVVQDAIARLIAEIEGRPFDLTGVPLLREGMKDTPARMERSWRELFSGYAVKDVESYAMKRFSNDEEYDEIVLVRDVAFYSTCEHHWLPFFGKCHVGYIPNKWIVGLSKVPRMIEIFTRRFQLQERMTVQIADCLLRSAEPHGVGVVVEAKHMCMCSRGVQKDATAVTSCLKGVFKQAKVGREFMSLVFGKRNFE